MRILLVTPYYAPAYYFGGPVRVLETIARGAIEAGHSVTVATTDALDATHRVSGEPAPAPPGVEIVRFPNVNHTLAARAMGWTPRGYRKWIRDHARDFDVIHLNDVYSVLSVAAARTGVPYVLQPHGSTAPSPERGRPLVKRAFLRLWGNRTIREASALLATTEAERADLLAAGAPADRIHVVPPPLDLPEVEPVAPPDESTVVFLGRIDPIKRIEVLLEAAEGMRVVIAGSGPERYVATLEARGGDFVGFVDGEEKIRTLQNAHVFCLLSRSEGLPVAALEAMACGTPVVLSKACNLPEAHERAGLVVEGSDAAEVRGAIERVIAERERFASGALALASGYRADRLHPRLMEIYDLARTSVTA